MGAQRERVKIRTLQYYGNTNRMNHCYIDARCRDREIFSEVIGLMTGTWDIMCAGQFCVSMQEEL